MAHADGWLDACGRQARVASDAAWLLIRLQTAPVRQYPNQERWVRGATLLGEWKVRAPRVGPSGPPSGGQRVWVPPMPRIVLTDAA